MATITRSTGVKLELADGLIVTDLASSAPGRQPIARRGAPLPRGPIPMPAPTALEDPVVESMRQQDMEVVDSIGIEVAAAPTARQAPTLASQLEVEVSASEDAVVLLESDGVYHWTLPARTESVQSRVRSGTMLEAPSKRLIFELDLEPTAAAGPDRTRLIGALLGKVIRAYVLKFVARLMVDAGVGFLERNVRRGFVVWNGRQWQPVESLAGLNLSGDRAARILLLVHGTFSSTQGSFGALAVSSWGQDFLASASSRYDIIVGYDHATLSEDPLQNASDLLARLEASGFELPPKIDAIAFSRGALVLRCLIEYLLPASRSSSPLQRVHRAIFVGGTNGGTELANPVNWKRLVDLHTNLAVAASKLVDLFGSPLGGELLRESVKSVGALVKYLASQAVEDHRVPGLSAMQPEGHFVRDLNQSQPGQPTAAEALYYVVTSDFDARLAAGGAGELPERLKLWLLDAFSDGLMREANDLVVHTRAMSAIDESSGNFVKDRFDLDKNPHVYHTIYFTRPEVVSVLTRWLELELLPATETAARNLAAALPAAADPSILVTESTRTYGEVIEAIDREQPNYVVVARDRGGESSYYAFRSDEIASVWQATRSSGNEPLWRALDANPRLALHETSESARTEVTSPLAIPERPTDPSPASRRTIVFDGEFARAVIDRAHQLGPTQELATGDRLRPVRGAGGREAPISPHRPTRGAALTSTPSEDATLFSAASMPESIPVGRAAQVFVRLSRDEITIEHGSESLQTTASAAFAADVPVIVQLVPKKHLQVIGTDRAVVDFTRKRRVELLFEVEATHAGPGELWVVIRQGAEAIATLALTPRTVAQVVGATPTIVATSEERLAPGGSRHPVLQIFERQNGNSLSYHFTLDLGDNSYCSGDSPPLRVDRGAYVAAIYREIETRWLSKPDDFDAFESELRSYGGVLFDELIPAVLQHALWSVRDSLQAIQVVSEEPFIPWEIVHLKPGPDAAGNPSQLPAESHFLAQKGLVRWLHNRGAAPARLPVRKSRAFHVIPNYSHPQFALPAALEEIPFLEQNLHATAVAAEEAVLRKLLAGPGAIDLLHFAGHGESAAQSASGQPTTRAQLMLTGRVEGGEYVPAYLDSSTVQQNARLVGTDGQRPIVVLNACQVGRAHWQLTSIGGFAEAFIRAGAGAFVSTLWAVGDRPAHLFTRAFYTQLLAGQPLAAAALAGRDGARKGREATWLAYVVYGNPHAQLELQGG